MLPTRSVSEITEELAQVGIKFPPDGGHRTEMGIMSTAARRRY